MKKQLITIAVNFKSADAYKTKADMLAVGVFEDDLKKSKTIEALDKKLGGSIGKLIKLGDFKAKQLSTACVYSEGKITPERILLVGFGKREKFSPDILRKASSLAAKTAVDVKCETLTLGLHSEIDSKTISAEKIGQVLAEGVYFGAYRYDEFVGSGENGRPVKLTVSIIDTTAASAKISKGIKTGIIIGQSQNISRTLANRPPNVVYPASLAAEAKKIASKTAGLTCKIFDYKQLKQKGFGGIVAVGQGAENKPVMIVLKYTPRGTKKIKAAPVALVGKAITFDSGGIDIKPSNGMDAMKMDMTGGASVMATMKAIAELKLPIPVYGIICSAENKPGSGSYRPGDIITTYSGKTVEILNTDAEGRIILCDGIHYAKELKCNTIVDICTLTGACIVALGLHKAGLMSNNDKLLEEMKQAAVDSGEPLWHLPCGDEYADEMKSKIADLRNISLTKGGGSSNAASFLAEFAGNTNWAHLDIAPTMEASDPLKKITTQGSIGFGVRLMTEYVIGLCK